MAREFGCEFAFLEMLNARSLSHKNRKIKELLKSNDLDKPLGAQLLGVDIEYLIRAAKFLETLGVSLIDFNAACPVKKVVKRGEGAALLKQPKKLKEILKALVENLKVPLSVKIRPGWDKDSTNAVEIGEIAQKAGVSALIIHGRHRAQGHKGKVSHNIIKEVKRNVDIPVIASGEIFSVFAAKKMFEETNCDGLLVARGAIGRPWIFKEIKQFLNEERVFPQFNIEEIKEIIFRHVRLAVENYGETVAMIKMRRILPLYVKSIKGAKEVRSKLNLIKTERDLRQILDCLN
jgi:nifR3 family TIM-barrel protein